MGGCAAVNCTNSSQKGFRMFRFPSDLIRKKKWIVNCRRSNWQPGSGARLCEVHFEVSQLEVNRKDGNKKLRPNAIPTIFDIPNCSKVPQKRLKGIGCLKSGTILDKLKSNLQNDVSNMVEQKDGVLSSRFDCQADDIKRIYSSRERKLTIKKKIIQKFNSRLNDNMEGLPKDSKSSDSPDSPTHILPTINQNLLAISQEPRMIVVDPESDMVVEIDPRAFVVPDMPKTLSEPGPSTRVEPDSSMAEDIPLAMTCEQFPAIEPVSQSMDIKIKQEPDDPSDILSANVERELGKFSQGAPTISSEDSLFQPPVLIKEEIVSEDEQ